MRTKAGLTEALEAVSVEPGVVLGGQEPADVAADDQADHAPIGDVDVFDLVRHRLGFGEDVGDLTIAVSLATIAGESEPSMRRQVALRSPLGRLLARRGEDLDGALDALTELAQLRLE